MTEFRYVRRVQFAETDLAGVVHFSMFFRYFEEAEHAMWRSAGLSIAPHGANVGFPRVSASIDFLAPLRFEDEFEVQVRIDKLSRRSIQYAGTMTSRGTTIARGTWAAVCVEKSVMRPIEIPEEIVGTLRRLAGGPTLQGRAKTGRP
jgi:YbgC/YbaW family acyl-CoA thioester hydrolase